jgi:hypothetical protein
MASGTHHPPEGFQNAWMDGCRWGLNEVKLDHIFNEKTLYFLNMLYPEYPIHHYFMLPLLACGLPTSQSNRTGSPWCRGFTGNMGAKRSGEIFLCVFIFGFVCVDLRWGMEQVSVSMIERTQGSAIQLLSRDINRSFSRGLLESLLRATCSLSEPIAC